jgi:hypothetical protein
MTGASRRLIKQLGESYTVRNATGGSGGRGTPGYSDDGTLVAVMERRGLPRTVTDSAGEDIEADLELRAVPDDDITIQPAGTADGYPTKLVSPDGRTYRVVDDVPDDGGVTVLSVVRD